VITRADAEEILAAFGPCSVLYETTSAKEVIDDVGDRTPRGYIEAQLVVEAVTNDRMEHSAAAREESGEAQYKDHHLMVVAENVEFIADLKARCTALMARKGW